MNGHPSLLVADDEFNTRETLIRYLRRRFQVTGAADGSEALDLLGRQHFDLVLTDLRMPGADGMSVLEAAQKCDPPVPCILLTAYGSIVDAVKAVKLGAFDFVSKPVKLDQLESVISSALSSGASAPEEPVRKQETGALTGIVLPDSASDPMQKLFETARAVAPSRAAVLLTGESGTGKEVVATVIHQASGRRGLFVPVHCAALTATLLESELFGHEKGAFTGAAEQRKGKFEIADGGTVFLDEIGEIDAATQVKLLRVLETRAFERVGGTETVHSDFRLISATNRDLRRMVAEGKFREDLFYRLSVINLELPPLRERVAEIPALLKHFAGEFAAENGKNAPEFSPELLKALLAYPWPGNIRELRNCVESMVVLAQKSVLDLADLPPQLRAVPEPSAASAAPGSALDIRSSERELIAKALRECGGNRTRAAEMLGISRRTLQRRLAENGLE